MLEDEPNDAAYDSILTPTVLGYHLINHPYSLTHMQQAYTNLYGSATGVTVTNKYVRFKPSNPQQLSLLDSLDIELFDYPLDYDIVQQGDYYDDGVTPAEEIPWLYTVVSSNFTPPAGITYEELEQIHVPTLAAVENEAFRITSNPVDDTSCTISGKIKEPTNSSGRISPNSAGDCPPGYVWDPIARRCVKQSTDPPPPTPTRQPSGTITVEDINFPGTGSDHFRPVRIARVVAKRFLKIERTYTDNQGHYYLTKEFNKAHILAKFKNSQAKIMALRRARLWQILSAVKRDFGKFKGTLSNLQHIIPYNQNALSRSARYWAAATAHNNVQEFYQFSALPNNNVGAPPTGIKILLSNWRGASGATPMYAKRVIQELPEDFLRFFVVGSAFAPLNQLAYILKTQVDVTVGYNAFGHTGTDQTSNPSDLNETMFHELTHAAHYNKVGNAWWNDFVDGELNNIIWHSNDNPPYGLGDQGSVSDIIGLGESWAYHMGHFMADWKYGMNSAETDNLQFTYANGSPEPTLSSHLNALEDFDNHRTNPDHWIPMGLYYDLIDNRNDQAFGRVNLIDQVSGYTNQQFFNALDADIRSLPAFRVRLLNENGNSQAAGVNTIFTFYNVF